MKVDPASEQSGMEIGVYTFGEIAPNPHSGQKISPKQRLEEIIGAAKIADEAGLDVFGVGEHHRLDYAVSTPPVILSAISQVTKRIKLTSATTVLNTIDPVRLFEDFATLDLLSNGRAEIIAGRGAFIEPFLLFGYDLEKYDELFEENIELFQKLNACDKVSWSGQYRSALYNAEISPRPYQEGIPIWVGVGGNPNSAARAGRLGTGLAIVILEGDPARFKPIVEKYRETAYNTGFSPQDLKVAVTGHVYISDTSQQARDEFYPYHSNYWGNPNQPPKGNTRLSREDFEKMTGPESALFVGSPQEIIEKILRQHELFGHQRFLAQMDIGGMPFKEVAKNIEKLATKVAPAVRKETKK